AVAIHVDGEIAEVIDVVVGEVDLAEMVDRPRRRFVPVLAGDDVGLSVLVDVRHGRSLARAWIEHAEAKRNVGRAAGAGEEAACRERNQPSAHGAYSTSPRRPPRGWSGRRRRC